MITLSFNAYTLFISVALVISVTFAMLLLFSRRTSKKADHFLAALVLVVAFYNFSLLVLELQIYQFAVGIIWVPVNYTLAIGPCLYFYVLYLTQSYSSINSRVWPHFIPVLVQVGFFLAQVFIAIPQQKGYFDTDLYHSVDPVISLLSVVSFVVYGYFARVKINLYHHWVKDNYSHYHRYQLGWLTRLTNVFVVLMGTWLVYVVVDYALFNYRLTFWHYYPLHIALAVVSIWLSIEAYLTPDIVFEEQSAQAVSVRQGSSVPNHDVTQNAELTQQTIWLKTQIEQNRLYLDAELSLSSLANYVGLHPNLLSRVINDGLHTRFSDLINQYRVDAVTTKFADPQHDKDTLLAIALDCGFNSKTSFNRVFKKHTGETPLSFRKSEKTTNI